MALDSGIKFLKRTLFRQCIYLSCYFRYNFMKLPRLVWNSFKQCKNVRFVSMVCSPMLSISKLTYLSWKMITAVFNVNEGIFLNSKKTMHLVKFQFYILYINFWSEHISLEFDGSCFSTVVLPVWRVHHNTTNNFLRAIFSSVCNTHFLAHVKLSKKIIWLRDDLPVDSLALA